jgi:hypothetical protein
MTRTALIGLGLLFCSTAVVAQPPRVALKEIEVRKIWAEAPHNAFTDLIRFQDRWYCSFREGEGHAKGAGKLRVITSANGQDWTSAALLESAGVDLRDPKLSRTPDGRLMMVAGAAQPASRDPVRDHYSVVSFSKDGQAWTQPQRVLDSWQWLWRVTWHKNLAFGVAYGWDPKLEAKPKTYQANLYRSKDGLTYEKVIDFPIANPTEATLVCDGDVMICLQRRDGQPNTAMLGISRPPYEKWDFRSLDTSFGGPNLLKLPDGTWLAAGRMTGDKGPRTVLCQLDVKAGTLTPVHTLPSGGDTSYAGLAWHDDQLWVSYYSSHEGKASIYLARLKRVK